MLLCLLVYLFSFFQLLFLLKEKLNISQNSKIVLGVGYGDKRKGIDYDDYEP